MKNKQGRGRNGDKDLMFADTLAASVCLILQTLPLQT